MSDARVIEKRVEGVPAATDRKCSNRVLHELDRGNPVVSSIQPPPDSGVQVDFNSKRHTVRDNLEIWNDEYDWSEDGDEWNGQARHCDQPYDKWKQSIIDNFILPYMPEDGNVLEIAAGHGRWSKELVDRCGHLTMLDLSPTCIEYCERLFADRNNVDFIINDGKTLTGVSNSTIDFVWSFDSFVHMSSKVIDSYLEEIRRVLKPGGVAVLHHPGRNNLALPFRHVRLMGKNGRRLYKLISLGKLRQDDGWRSDISRERVTGLAQKNGLAVYGHFRRWGKDNEFTLERYNDYITVMTRESVA